MHVIAQGGAQGVQSAQVAMMLIAVAVVAFWRVCCGLYSPCSRSRFWWRSAPEFSNSHTEFIRRETAGRTDSRPAALSPQSCAWPGLSQPQVAGMEVHRHSLRLVTIVGSTSGRARCGCWQSYASRLGGTCSGTEPR